MMERDSPRGLSASTPRFLAMAIATRCARIKCAIGSKVLDSKSAPVDLMSRTKSAGISPKAHTARPGCEIDSGP